MIKTIQPKINFFIKDFDKIVCIRVSSEPPLKYFFEVALRKDFYNSILKNYPDNYAFCEYILGDIPEHEYYVGVTKNYLKWYANGHNYEYNAQKYADVFTLAKAKKWEQIICDGFYNDGFIKDLNGEPLWFNFWSHRTMYNK